MLDHVVLTVGDLKRSAAFYKKVLGPLGHKNEVRYPGHEGHAPLRGFGDADEKYLLLKEGKPVPTAVHLAFSAKSKKVVQAFHRAALAAGGKDNGPPGVREHYFASYYAAYVLDPDGYNVEAVYLGD